MSLVKKICPLKSQDKKAPEFSDMINITHCPFNASLHKEISCLRSNKFDDETIFFTHLIHFLFQNLKEFPWVSICSVSKTQCSSDAVSSYRLILKVISATFHAAEWRNLAADVGVSYFFRDAEAAVRQFPPLGLSQQPKNCIRWPETDPSYSVTCISLRLAMLACGSSLAASTARDLEEMKATNNIWRSLGAC
jgi:hypothetical protein